ncbi:cobaltochelatase subunit CobN [Hydrococcus rivularis NIES-593]|uniref:Cobaltochelatase subunit CobN n=1 Tax=Hydrococcus rivularis NIES-593 TaxID=1921803 RepID=A0A1U7HRJ3_9CYAN|nr:cobaltochelatase subunit CobN [Hydrococcus rivularis]OKH26191.1 cobaltochelatase subunit CobN [Hydrococcus rivularis NIES-593]
MHRITATPGGWNSDSEGVIFIEQTPAPIVLLTAADTDIQTLAACVSCLPSQFPAIRVVNLLQLQQQLSIDTYADTILSQAKVIILRLLGGRSYWSYGLEVLKEIAQETEAFLFILPGDDRPDPDLMSHSTVSLATVNRLWRYFTEGGRENWINALKFVADVCLRYNYNPSPPKVIPRVGLYDWQLVEKERAIARPKVGLLFYRAHYLAGNTLPIDAICQALKKKNLSPIPVFISSLRDPDVQEELLTYFQPSPIDSIELLLNTTSFSLARIGKEEQSQLWQKINVPVLQVILSSTTEEKWKSSFQGLTPRDVAMNVALPEVDGRIITRAVSFKSVKTWNKSLETDVVVYQPKCDRINFIADLAANWIRLRRTPISKRKIALILANYPNRDGRIANGVGLDTPASCIEILKALQNAGYFVRDIPENGDELIRRLTVGITNDPEGKEIRLIHQKLSLEDYQKYFSTLPEKVQKEICDRWGDFRKDRGEKISSFPIPGIQLGNIFIGIQPSRGYDRDPSLNYHAPDLEPTHDYLAYYYWLRQKFGASAIVHLGKHGNLEWLPGKSIALSETCYPEVTLKTLPNFYPFIVNDPGEGSQAKRRSHAVILDHLTPPLTRAELYGDLEKLEALIDEYYEAQNLDPSRLKIISDRISKLITKTNLNKDLGIDKIDPRFIAQYLTLADGYLCELKEAQIRDGLHIFGQCPQGKQLRDLIVSIARSPSRDRLGLTRAIAQDLHLDFNPLTANPSDKFSPAPSPLNKGGRGDRLCERLKNARTQGDAIEAIEEYAAELIENPTQTPLGQATQKELEWIQNILLSALQKTPQEITNLLNGLDGKYVPSGASGAPTRGRPEVLPTGRNFYSVDIRAIPTETAWDVGRKAAEALVERYTQENGEYPKTLAISIWGTSTMRTGGDDVAQVLALLGVQPVWDSSSRRVVDFEILSPSALGRPRVDVTVRISGFFRDSFPNILELLYDAINAVSSLKEEKEINPLAAQVEADTLFWQQQGLEKERAKQKSCYRIFGSKPGAYGAGLQGLIEAQNWQDDEDLARAYINWSSYAYDKQGIGHAAPEVFERRLKQLQVVLHNQDNREHDLLDSDDYYQFQGGLTAAVRALTGKNPQTYFGDNSIPANPKVRLLREEIARVYRSRVVNPKWIESVMRHGYKGAFEMAATVDYLFAYDATARCVEDFMYQGVAEAYLFDEKVQQFIQEKNPWALRDMAERLLEANQRGLWQSVGQETLEKLRELVHQAEGIVERMSGNTESLRSR